MEMETERQKEKEEEEKKTRTKYKKILESRLESANNLSNQTKQTGSRH